MVELPNFSQPQEISGLFREVGKIWAASIKRPRIAPEVRQHWESLVDEWAESDLPLVIRKGSGVRGEEIIHPQGRRVIIADNSPAQWSFLKAFQGCLYTLKDIKNLIEQNKIPFAFAAKSNEKDRIRYTHTLTSAESLGKRGWKLCHIERVGLNTRQPIGEIALSELKQRFRLLLKPSNQFLVPLDWAGMGELTEVIEEVHEFEKCELS
jgi:hypothetical protein